MRKPSTVSFRKLSFDPSFLVPSLMLRDIISMYRMLFLILLIRYIPVVHGQNVGTQEQDITSIPAYSQQKNCAISCFQYSGAFCFNDFLGNAVGCAQTGLCESKGWLARNDCYCNPTQIKTGLQYLEGCVAEKCSVGDVSVDVAMATSLYEGYCSGKGYTAATAPANVPANPTGAGDASPAPSGFRTTSRIPAPTSSDTGSSSNSPSESSSKSLSTGTIIGIVVGSLAGLAFLALAMKTFWKLFGSCCGGTQNHGQQPPPQQVQPIYPKMSDQQLWNQYPSPSSEVGPGDSVSMVGGMARPAPTLVSDVRYPGSGRW